MRLITGVFFFSFQCLLLNLFSPANGSLFYRPTATTEATPNEAINKWKQMESDTSKSVQGLVKQLMTILSASNSTLDIGGPCVDALYELTLAMIEMKLWPFKMLDSSGKPSGGQLIGSAGAFGSYDECLDIIVPDESLPGNTLFTGQYCLADFRPPLPARPNDHPLHYEEVLDIFKNYTPKTELMRDLSRAAGIFYDGAFRFGICVPSKCSKEDIKSLVSNVAENILWHADIVSCEIKEETRIDPTQLFIICVFGSLILLVFLSTTAQYFSDSKTQNSTIKRVFLSFAIQRNVKDFFSPVKNDKKTPLQFLHGVRFISMTWVVLGHSYLCTDIFFYRNAVRYFENMKTIHSQAVTNGFLSVDSFFFITSFLIAYMVVSYLDKNGSNEFKPFILLIRRIWRFLPSVMLIVAIMILMPLFSTGPLWKNETEPLAEICKERWWITALFVTNFYPLNATCVPHSWYLGVDMQLYLISFIYLYLLYKKSFLAYFVLFSMIFGSMITTGLIVYLFKDPPALVFYIMDSKFLTDLPTRGYYLPTAHMGIYGIGLALGTYLARSKGIKLSKFSLVAGWILAIACNLSVVYGLYGWNGGFNPSNLVTAFYSGIHRTAWGLGLGWLSLMCFTGRGGVINTILSWDGFVILNRASFAVYMIHIPVIFFFVNSHYSSIEFNHKILAWVFMGNFTMSFGLAFLIRILFEGPLILLDKIVFEKRGGVKIDKKMVGEKDLYLENSLTKGETITQKYCQLNLEGIPQTNNQLNLEEENDRMNNQTIPRVNGQMNCNINEQLTDNKSL